MYKRKTCECCGAPKYDGRHNLLIAIAFGYECKIQSMTEPFNTNPQEGIEYLKEQKIKHNITDDEMFAIITKQI